MSPGTGKLKERQFDLHWEPHWGHKKIYHHTKLSQGTGKPKERQFHLHWEPHWEQWQWLFLLYHHTINISALYNWVIKEKNLINEVKLQ